MSGQTLSNLLFWLAIAAQFSYFFADVMYRRSVRGTEQRYIWASVSKIFLYLYALLPLACLLQPVLDPRLDSAAWHVGWALLAVWNGYAWWRQYEKVRDRDDDDIFKKSGRRLRRWARANLRLRVRAAATAGAS
jgi:hypothetical protein